MSSSVFLPPSAAFRHCPRCGRERPAPGPDPVLSCAACGFQYHFNPAVAAGVIAEDAQGRVLVVRRATDPGRGLLGVPGGFVDIGEAAEEAARREAVEETGVEVAGLSYLGSWPNVYEFRGIAYPVLDLYFVARARDGSAAAARHEVAEVLWVRPEELDEAALAFPTTREAFRRVRDARAERRGE
jgi:ADP-ribose pyrophosphatase